MIICANCGAELDPNGRKYGDPDTHAGCCEKCVTPEKLAEITQYHRNQLRSDPASERQVVRDLLHLKRLGERK